MFLNSELWLEFLNCKLKEAACDQLWMVIVNCDLSWRFWILTMRPDGWQFEHLNIWSEHLRIWELTQTSYLSRTHGRCPWRKNLSCGEISNSCTWQMWRSLKFIPMWINFKFLRMTDVEKSEISFNMCTINGILLHFKLFCCKICVFLAIYAVLSQNWFIAIYALLCGENFSQK